MQSLKERIEQLEDELITHQSNDLLSKLKHIEHVKKNKQVEDMNNTYKLYISEFCDIGNSDDINNNFVQILIHTIKYVNQNADNISKVVGIKKSEELFEIICSSFVIDLNCSFSQEMIINSIKTIKPMIKFYEESLIEPERETIVEQPIKKKSMFSKKK